MQQNDGVVVYGVFRGVNKRDIIRRRDFVDATNRLAPDRIFWRSAYLSFLLVCHNLTKNGIIHFIDDDMNLKGLF